MTCTIANALARFVAGLALALLGGASVCTAGTAASIDPGEDRLAWAADVPLCSQGVRDRLVPAFRFAVLYNKDLEILPGPSMALEGPVHSNGDLYVGSYQGLNILGPLTTSRDLYRGRKDSDWCMPGSVRAAGPSGLAELPVCVDYRRRITRDDVAAWRGMVLPGVDVVVVPPPETFDPVPGEIYWDSADLRIMLDLDEERPVIEVRDAKGVRDRAATATLAACKAAEHTNDFFDNRESTLIEMLDIDVGGLLDCIHRNSLMGQGKDLGDTTDGGLVWYLGVDGPRADLVNDYGVRLRNGGTLMSGEPGAPRVRGLTVVTNQAVYIWGDYNAVAKRPAAVLADSLNVLSNAWTDLSYGGFPHQGTDLNSRIASDTTINAAFLAGTQTTGGLEGAGGQSSGGYNGGLENYPRFHEKWSGRTLTYRGSFVSFNRPIRADGTWVYGFPQYTAPTRDWGYDIRFNEPDKLPPLSPMVVLPFHGGNRCASKRRP